MFTPAAKETPLEPASPATPASGGFDPALVDAIRTVYDPEIPVNIYEMGLIYGIVKDAAGAVVVTMTLTSPACPEAMSLPQQVESAVRSVPGVASAKVELVWDPPWDPSRMTEAAKLQLGML